VLSPFDRNTATTLTPRAFPALSERNTIANVAPAIDQFSLRHSDCGGVAVHPPTIDVRSGW
jgi:hypothetical protein